MPLVTVEAIPPGNEKAIPRALAEIRRAGAEALNGPESNIWVVFRPLTEEFYSHASAPAIVTIKAKTGRTQSEKNVFTEKTAAIIAEALSISPSCVWIHYQEMNPSDVWFEGRWSNALS